HLLPLNKFTTSSAFCQHLCKETLTVLSNVTPGKNIRNSYPQGYTENNKRRVNTIGKSKCHFPYHSTHIDKRQQRTIHQDTSYHRNDRRNSQHMIRDMKPMNGFDSYQTHDKASHKRTDHRTIS